MTHAESQDLLLDLAYGELDDARATELSAHVAGCDECRKEKAALDEMRRAAAPLRELEEPSAGFDDRVLQAARAQAQLDHDGSVGQVIEVAGSVKPLGLDPGRIDAHAAVERRQERRRPRWMVRAALAGSVATAAALALVVSTTVQSRRDVQTARPEDYQIRVQPAAPQAVDSALRDAENNSGAAPAPSPVSSGTRPATPSTPAKLDQLALRKASRADGRTVEGGGGDAADSNYAAKAQAKAKVAERAEADRAPAAVPESPPPAAQAPPPEPPPPAATAPEPPAELASRAAPAAGGAENYAVAHPSRPVAGVAAAQQKKQAVASAVEQPSPDRLEGSAQEARHGGNYQLASALYRKAAALRRDQSADDPTAAWDLAHAVECLAAAGLFDDARAVREELQQLYPSQAMPLSAARRALREVEGPAPAKVDPQR